MARKRSGLGTRRAIALLFLTFVACRGSGSSEAGQKGLGTRLVATQARTVVASHDGRFLAYLDHCNEARGQFLPDRTANCDLWVVSVEGDRPQKVASAVTTLPSGVVWHGRAPILAAVGDYDYPTGSGTLYLWAPGKGSQKVAEGVTFHGFSRSGEDEVALAFGRLLTAGLDASPKWLPKVEGLTSFELNPASSTVPGPRAVMALLRGPNRNSPGGLLFARTEGGEVSEVSRLAGDYRFAPGGKAFAFTEAGEHGYALRLVSGESPPRLLGQAVRTFEFSVDGSALAAVLNATPGRAGDLWLFSLDGKGTKIATNVGDLVWASARTPPRLAWLEAYDERVRQGRAGAGGPGMTSRTFGSHVSDLAISPDGQTLAFLEHTTRGGYSVDLFLAKLEGQAPAWTVAKGVFGFGFSPDSAYLYLRTRCERNGEACDLMRIPTGAPRGEKPKLVAQGVKSFEFDPSDPDRLLLGWQRTDRVALDLGVFERGRLIRVDSSVEPGSAHFTGEGRRLAYVVVDARRAGVYVADLPDAP